MSVQIAYGHRCYATLTAGTWLVVKGKEGLACASMFVCQCLRHLMAIATAAIEPTATFSATGRIHGTSKILLLRLFRCWPPSSNCLLSLPVVPLLLSPAEVGSFFWTAGQASRSLNFVLQPQNKAIILLKSKAHSFDMHLIVNLNRSSDDRPGALRLPKTSTSWSAPPFHCRSQCCWWQSCCGDSWCRCPDYCYC